LKISEKLALKQESDDEDDNSWQEEASEHSEGEEYYGEGIRLW